MYLSIHWAGPCGAPGSRRSFPITPLNGLSGTDLFGPTTELVITQLSSRKGGETGLPAGSAAVAGVLNTHLIAELVKLRYKLLWANTRSRNGRIALFLVGYLLLALLIALLTTGGFAAAFVAVRAGQAEKIARLASQNQLSKPPFNSRSLQ
jgi:hypothetical protein